jgi:hypothetical protein
VAGIQTGIVSGLPFGNPGIKSLLDVGATERRKEYYMGEGGGFPRVQAVVSLVSPELPVACPNIEGVLESELTNLLVGLMQILVNNQSLSLILIPSRSSSTPPLPLLVLRVRSVPRVPHNSAV